MRLLVIIILLTPFFHPAQTSPAGVLTSAACKLWIDAGDLNGDGNYGNNPAAGTAVSTWNDKSTNANDLTQATTAAKPTYSTSGGYGCVKFDNTGSNANYLNVTTQTMLTPGTMYFVLNMVDAGDGANCLFDRNSSGNTSIRFNQWNGTNQLGYTKYATADYNTTITCTFGSMVILSYLKTAASNNVDIAQNSSSVTLTVGSSNPGLPLYVLGKNSTADGMNGFIMEALAYNVALNNAQKFIVDNYLSAKYGGISILSDMYAGDTPANGNYDFEVAGVGTDASGNNATAASSISGGLQVAQATAMGNGEYLIYGHPTGTNSINFFDVGGMSAGANKARWNRIWYFDWTHVGGTNETVDLTFDYSDAGSAGGSAVTPLSNYKLLYRAGLSGNWTEVMNASSITGDRVTFSGLAWNTQGDGYYTIGTLDNSVSPLPITLIDFIAEPCNNRVCLYWSTASEKNTNYFVIERSEDGLSWEEVSRTTAAKNSDRKTDYTAVDDMPLKGNSYYRLTTVDLDLSRSSAPVQFLQTFNGENDFIVFPNPTTNVFTITSPNYSLSGLTYQITNEQGENLNCSPQLLPENKINFDLSNFPKGVYFLKINSENSVLKTKRIVRD